MLFLGKYDISYARYSCLAFTAYLFLYPFLDKSYTIGIRLLLLILLNILIYWCACRVRAVVIDARHLSSFLDSEEV